ncbi:hypothetical protein KSP40_PGU014765 [Platanthera guangdongensis]|uniref:Uncharacterized protein n=1 Tax=Platanthera guangdongensis TaxID=2320717 RepID=A0ABR2LFS4_9ASPA
MRAQSPHRATWEAQDEFFVMPSASTGLNSSYQKIFIFNRRGGHVHQRKEHVGRNADLLTTEEDGVRKMPKTGAAQRKGDGMWLPQNGGDGALWEAAEPPQTWSKNRIPPLTFPKPINAFVPTLIPFTLCLIYHPPPSPLILRPLFHSTSLSALLSFYRWAKSLARSSSIDLTFDGKPPSSELIR